LMGSRFNGSGFKGFQPRTGNLWPDCLSFIDSLPEWG
jgi:hypothetical protein